MKNYREQRNPQSDSKSNRQLLDDHMMEINTFNPQTNFEIQEDYLKSNQMESDLIYLQDDINEHEGDEQVHDESINQRRPLFRANENNRRSKW